MVAGLVVIAVSRAVTGWWMANPRHQPGRVGAPGSEPRSRRVADVDDCDKEPMWSARVEESRTGLSPVAA